jgi:hypothetical protein
MLKGDLVDKIMALESGEMDEEQAVEFYQELIDSGLAWKLQGCYGRTASRLIEAGLCHPAGAKGGD